MQKSLQAAVSESELREAVKHDKDTASIGSTLPHSPASSTCLSSQSIQSVQSVQSTQDEKEVHVY